MIEVANRERSSAENLDELVEILGVHIGRTLKIEAPASRATYIWSSIPKATSFGPLKWVQLSEGQDIIWADLGRPFELRDHGTCELIDLTDTISVLSDGVWHVLHAPRKKEEN